MRPALLTAVVVGLLTASALAQPAGNERKPAPPGEPPLSQRLLDLQPDQKLEKATYLGVATSPAPKALRHQVELPQGVGLVIDAVAPDSPAAVAGLKQHDLLHKLDDQLLVNPQQLAVLVRTFKPGDTVELTVLRGGKPTELSAKLTERDLPPLDELRLDVQPRLPDGRGLVPNDLSNVPPGNAGIMSRPPLNRLLNEHFTVSWDDGTVTMTVNCNNGKRTLIARDKEGKELFAGPIDTAEQREALPPQVRERMKHVMVHDLGAGAKTRPSDPQPKDQKGR